MGTERWLRFAGAGEGLGRCGVRDAERGSLRGLHCHVRRAQPGDLRVHFRVVGGLPAEASSRNACSTRITRRCHCCTPLACAVGSTACCPRANRSRASTRLSTRLAARRSSASSWVASCDPCALWAICSAWLRRPPPRLACLDPSRISTLLGVELLHCKLQCFSTRFLGRCYEAQRSLLCSSSPGFDSWRLSNLDHFLQLHSTYLCSIPMDNVRLCVRVTACYRTHAVKIGNGTGFTTETCRYTATLLHAILYVNEICTDILYYKIHFV